MKIKHTFQWMTVLVLSVFIAVGCMMTASAADLCWNLLTDTDAGYRVEDRHGRFDEGKEADGTPYMYHESGKGGAFYIYDDGNILGTYRTFSLEGDFYFDAFPEGTRDSGKYTSDQKPLSFLCWVYKDITTGELTSFNAIRIDSQGYIHTKNNGSGKTDVKLETGRWYNLRCVFTPETGVSELFVDGKPVLDFTITAFDASKYMSGAVRYFDGYFNWSAKMKNLMVKTDDNYVIGMRREAAAEYIGVQTAKPEGNTFDARVILGVDGTEYNRVGYEIIKLQRDEYGLVFSESLSARSKVVYQTLKDANGKSYEVSGDFGHTYASAVVIKDLPTDPMSGYLELTVRPYVLGMDGVRRYGKAVSLVYVGETDADGYPVLSGAQGVGVSVPASDDTYIYNHSSHGRAFFPDTTVLQARNTGTSESSQFRAAYYRFVLDAEAVKSLQSAASAKLRIAVKGTEENSERVRTDIIVHATGIEWTEETLNYNNHKQMAPTGEQLFEGEFRDNSYLEIDILSFLKDQALELDGSLIVSFRVTNVGKENAIVTHLYSKESANPPSIEIESSLYSQNWNLEKTFNDGYEPWGYAEMLVDEWFDTLKDEIYPKDQNGTLIYHDSKTFAPNGYNADTPTGDFTREMEWRKGILWSTNKANGYIVTADEWNAAKYARTLSTLGTSKGTAFLDSKYADVVSEYDVYGGIANAGFKGEATGFFHTERHGGRSYIIDPLGNPYFALGVNTVVLGDSENHKIYSLAKYGTEENFYAQMTQSLKAMGINTCFVSNEALLKVENGLACVVELDGVRAYMKSIGRDQVSEGVFPHNNTINVFEPDYISFVNKANAKNIADGGYADMTNLFGYTVDNELPSGGNMFDRYLTMDASEPGSAFSYATAWTFLARYLDTPAPTLSDFQLHPDRAAIESEFLSFVYANVYRVIKASIEAVDTNHMYLGSRVYSTCMTDEGYLRAAGHYLDILTFNLYGGLNPSAETITNIYRYAGTPVIVTEFFAKGIDAIDANGYPLANSTGAGILVYTQQDRADYYEHYALAMLEAGSCVGWTWYRFRDNDQGVYKTDKYDALIMLHTTYGANPHANTFMDVNTGTILPDSTVGEYTEIYKGEKLASNHNVNKGIYNSDFSSHAAVYTYDKNGKLTGSKTYEVQSPDGQYPAEGTVLTTMGGAQLTVGKASGADGGYTETVLTVYEGKYVALSDAIKKVSDHLLGIVQYFDEK